MSASRRDAAAGMLVALLAVLPYLGAPSFGPTYDDHAHVVSNTFLLDPPSFTELSGYFERAVPDQSRPTMLASLLLDRAMFGDAFRPYHWQNLFLHAIAAWLAFALVRRLGIGTVPALAGAALFALHPACTEAVASVSNREELLVAAFGVGALLAARRALDGATAWSALAALLFAVALLAKEVALALPLLFVALAHHPRWAPRASRRGWLTVALATLPGLAAFAFLHVRLGFPGLAIGAGGEPLTLDVGRGLAAATWADVPQVVCFRAFRLLVGWPLSAEHDVASLRGLAPMLVGGLATALLLVLTVVFARRRRTPYVALAWFWCASLPTLIGPWLLNPLADRYLYLPALGVLTALGAWLAMRRPRVVTLALLALLAIFATRTADRARVWRSDVSLFLDATQRAPASARAWQNLGAAYLREGRPDEAIGPLAHAIELDPERAASHLGMGTALWQTGRREQAALSLERAIELHVPPAELPVHDRAFDQWVRLMLRLGRIDEARSRVQAALRNEPDFVPAQRWAERLSRERGE